MHCKFLTHLLRSLGAVTAFLAMTFAGCSEVDDTLGSNYIPDNQQLEIGFRQLKGCFETRLYRTDSIRTSNIDAGLLGSTISDTFGLRTAGFYTQFTWGICPDSVEGFGYRPIFDSLLMGFSVKDFHGDSTRMRSYEVYEVIDNSFLAKQTDTLFYGTFDISPYIAPEPAFTFRFPDPERRIYPSSTSVKLEPTERGLDLVERLMLKKGAYTDNNLDGFYNAPEFCENFKGLYFKPAADATTTEENSLIHFKLSESGMILYGRNRNQIDPTLIQDTTASLYYFNDSSSKGGKASINTFKRDYSQSLLADQHFEEQEERSLTEICLVEGMAGVITEITLTQEFFMQLEQIIEQKAEEGNRYHSLAINQALLCLYDSEADYDWEKLTPNDAMIARWDNSIERLGLYSNFKKLIGIADYNYAYEEYYDVTLNYGGYLNRSRGCYLMDIAIYLQELWNSYLQDKEAVLEDASKRTIYLGPEAYDINSFAVTTGQGMGNSSFGMNAMKLDLTYTLIK